MEFTNKQRHEVAEKLRAKYRERRRPGMWECQELGMQRENILSDIEDCLPNDKDDLAVLADLIDPPTCTMHYEETMSGDELYPTDAWQCDECGEVDYDGKPRFCRGCGSRVTND